MYESTPIRPAFGPSFYSTGSSATPVAIAPPEDKPKGLRGFWDVAKGWIRTKWHNLLAPKPQVQTIPASLLKMQYNLVLSPLYQLPDELVLQICRELQGSDVYIMRQTCSLFKRILSHSEFVCRMQWDQPVRGRRDIVDLPRIGIDWEDVFERLRRRRCCSACIDARLPQRTGGDSAYDRTMLRMANETKYCVACRGPHPLIMFSPHERYAESDARCILAEGGVAICPHHTVYMRHVREWYDIMRHSKDDLKKPPWLLRCDQCFQDLPEPLRSSSAAVPPSATYLLPKWNESWATKGALCVQWTLPLQVDVKTVVDANEVMLDGAYDLPPIAKLDRALSIAAKDYNDLLCPHTTFDDLRTLHSIGDGLCYTVTDFERGDAWKSELGSSGFVQSHRRTPLRPTGDSICRVCSWPGQLREQDKQQRYEYLWTLGPHGLSLQRQLKLTVPNLSEQQFSLAHEAWLQMMNPPSYGLPDDTELRHITWCPDRQCANGRSWAAHVRHLGIIAKHFDVVTAKGGNLPWFHREGFFSPVYRKVDVEVMVPMGGSLGWKLEPHVFRGVRFLPSRPTSQKATSSSCRVS